MQDDLQTDSTDCEHAELNMLNWTGSELITHEIKRTRMTVNCNMNTSCRCPNDVDWALQRYSYVVLQGQITTYSPDTSQICLHSESNRVWHDQTNKRVCMVRDLVTSESPTKSASPILVRTLVTTYLSTWNWVLHSVSFFLLVRSFSISKVKR